MCIRQFYAAWSRTRILLAGPRVVIAADATDRSRLGCGQLGRYLPDLPAGDHPHNHPSTK
jgi:hypothetical protein